MLHIVNKSPFTHSNLESAINFAQDSDAILLYEDGVCGAQAGTKIDPMLKKAMTTNTIYALEEDLKARGITNLVHGIQTVNYGGFVDLVEKDKVNSWL